MTGAIALCDWNACDSCKNFTDEGCLFDGDIDVALVDGDFIICEQFESV